MLSVFFINLLLFQSGFHGNSQMAIAPDGKLLALACPDAGTVCAINLPSLEVAWQAKVGNKPESVSFAMNGTICAVSIFDDDLVVLLDAKNGTVKTKIVVPDEPYGIVCSANGEKLFVTHDYPSLVSEIHVPTGKIIRSFPSARRNRGIALSPDESRLFVTEFLTGNLVAIEVKSGKIVDQWHGHSTDNLARHVVVHPQRPKAYVSHIRSRVNVIDGGGSIFPHLTVHDLVPPSNAKRTKSFGMDTFNGVFVVTNPWEADISPDGKRIYTLYSGTDDMNVSEIVDDDYSEIRLVGSAVRVGHNPRAVRVSHDGKSVFVFDSLDFQVRRLDSASMRVSGMVKVSVPEKSPDWIRGKLLFNSARPPMSSRMWVACSSCHPDGQPDGRVWFNPEGMRKTPSLSGLAHTHPLHYSADRDESQDFEFTIRSRLMQGAGLIPGKLKEKVPFKPTELEVRTSGKSKDLDALAVYTNSFGFTLSPHLENGQLSASAKRGMKLFEDESVGCSKCHSGPYYSDSSLSKPFRLHDVGTGKEDTTEKIGTQYDTPTLLGIYKTPPYLHDGKAKTLFDVLTTANKKDKHGKTSHLTKTQTEDLVDFLKSLPFENPPLKTPNTIEYFDPVR